MEFIEGQSLREKIETGPLKIDEAIKFAMQIADGLQAAHEKGITHRDIKSASGWRASTRAQLVRGVAA